MIWSDLKYLDERFATTKWTWHSLFTCDPSRLSATLILESLFFVMCKRRPTMLRYLFTSSSSIFCSFCSVGSWFDFIGMVSGLESSPWLFSSSLSIRPFIPSKRCISQIHSASLKDPRFSRPFMTEFPFTSLLSWSISSSNIANISKWRPKHTAVVLRFE